MGPYCYRKGRENNLRITDFWAIAGRVLARVNKTPASVHYRIVIIGLQDQARSGPNNRLNWDLET
jgi:hypothetical protein